MKNSVTDKNGATINVNDTATVGGVVTSVEPVTGTVTVRFTQPNGQSVVVAIDPSTITRGEPII